MKDEVKTTSGVLENNSSKRVNSVQQGAGAPVILTHGLAASLHDWDDLLPELSASGYAGYALDLFGHGESHKPANHDEYTFDAVFEHFSAWIDSLNLVDPLILIGHSLGAGLSLQYALRHPERVRALVLVNPFYDIQQLPPILQLAFRRKLINTTLIERTPYRLFRFFVDMTSINFHMGSRETHILPEHIRYQTALDYTRAASGIYNIPRSLPNLTSDLSRIQQPTLLLWGNRDQSLNTASFPKIEKKLPNVVASQTFPICGHVPHQCHPEQLNPHVMKFLKNL
ncbi:MAG: alpha/beta hydrolase [Anaerolineales bacterium]|nr:alpha/beta hydrolase [Anaerolineales bacterium]